MNALYAESVQSDSSDRRRHSPLWTPFVRDLLELALLHWVAATLQIAQALVSELPQVSVLQQVIGLRLQDDANQLQLHAADLFVAPAAHPLKPCAAHPLGISAAKPLGLPQVVPATCIRHRARRLDYWQRLCQNLD